MILIKNSTGVDYSHVVSFATTADGKTITASATTTGLTPVVFFNGVPVSTLTITALAAQGSAFANGGTFLNAASNGYRLDVTLASGPGYYTLKAENATYAMFAESIQIANATDSFFGVTTVVDNATSTRNSFGLGFSGSANFSSLVAQLGTLTLNGGISQQAASTNSTGSILFGPPVLFVPVTGTYVNQLALVLRNNSGALIDAISATTTATLPNGTDLSNDVDITHISTGFYKCTFTENATNSISPVTFTFITTSAGPISRTLTLTVPAMRLPGQYTTSGTNQYLQSDMRMDAGATQSAGDIVALINGLSGGGSGAFAVNVPFVGLLTDSSTIVLEGVKSTATKSGIPTVGPISNASGVSAYNLDAGAWTVAAFLGGYSCTGSSMTVSSSGTMAAIILVQNAVPAPTDPNDCAVYFYTVDQSGAVVPGTNVSWELSNPEDDTVVANGTSNSAAITGLWSLDVRIPASGSTYIRVTTPVLTINAQVPYTTTPNSSIKIAGP